jgi:hypothetical protein
LFKTVLTVDFFVEVVVLIACGLAWAAVGFPRLTEVATVGGLALACFGVYFGIIWNKK